MRLSQCLFLLLIFFLKGSNTTNTSNEHPCYCHDEESFALLQFKQSFTINTAASGFGGAYPKVLSWKPAHGGNRTCCCAWDGVECDQETGHVIGLDLSSSYLYGSINSNSSIFRLVHLQRLNLSDNHFNYSQIPTSIRNFPSLTHLNLSDSVFSGRVPFELSQLVKLSTLDLSFNLDPSSMKGLLKLDGSNFKSLVQNLTGLQTLYLSFINISSPVPEAMANLSFLTSLVLRDCGIFGEFPVRIFKLQNLKILRVCFNQDLIGHVPEFNRSSPLMSLLLADTSFSGNLPSTIEKLDSLNELDVSGCSFSGVIPFSLGNLKQLIYLNLSKNSFTGPIPASLANLTQLTFLSLSMNNVGGTFSWIGKQTKLTVLDLNNINLSGGISSSLGNLTQLTYLKLRSNKLGGPIPSLLGNLSKLVGIDLTMNSFNSSIPESLFNLMDLKWLSLSENDLDGKVDVCKLQSAITNLYLGGNKLEVPQCKIMNTTLLPKFLQLGLRDCNIEEFPDFLRHQQNLMWLELGGNNIHGQIPKWMWNTSTQSLELLDISQNFLSGFGQSNVVLPWVNLQVLSASSNLLDGPLPIPPQNIVVYAINGNKLTREISPSMCNLTTLQLLDLSYNKLSGTIPHCIGNFSDHLTHLSLGNNLFHGTLPQTFTNKSNLRVLDLSQNQLQGQLPRSLANCLMLEILILSNNNFNDNFPFWLRTLPELKILEMRRNAFLGVIRKPKNNQVRFPKLHILDLSYNNFTGEFPAEYIFSKYAMRSNITVNSSTYMEVFMNGASAFAGLTFTFDSSMTITSKGVDRYYSKMQEAFSVIDISSNKFVGKIDEWIGNLKGLWSLNVSNNLLTGGIPSSLGNLTQLESLDLSNNKLSGEIPQQLAQLTFLSQFNVSHNNLTGPIPHGTQLMGFNVTSYEGNSGLCGDPLPKKCGNSNTPAQLPASRTNENDSRSGIEFDWIFVLAGFGSGFVVGVVLADVAITRRRALFLEIVGILIRLMERITSWKRFGHRN